MCGLVAQISKSIKKPQEYIIRSMSKKILHRGPDDEGYFINNWIGLGFRRLSIIDTSQAGHQPMIDETGRYSLVFNGEIYNYIELRNYLKTKGILFHTQSDTEVLLKSYLYWKEACLDKLVGMFSFIVADNVTRKVFIARDFPGIKPLYFTEDKNYWYFASELKAFKEVVPFELNTEVLAEQFNYRFVAGEKTLIKNITKLLPGHYWIIDQDKPGFIKKKHYFSYLDTFVREDKERSFENNVALISQKLKDNFLLHTRSDVGFCAQLSGGVDSSYMTAVLSESSTLLNTYSISLDDEKFNESQYQQEIIRKYNLKHHDYRMNDRDYADSLEKTTYYMDAPVTHSGCVFLMKLCDEISKTSKVVLTGEGADELFGGYAQHDPSMIKEWSFKLHLKGIRLRFLPDLPKLRTLKKMLNDDLILNLTRYQQDGHYKKIFNIYETDAMLKRKEYASLKENNFLASILAYDQHTYLASVLERQDRISMAHSVEARVPYCNQELYSLVNPIKNSIKFKGKVRKALLKKCAEPYLSKKLLYRRKNGLRLPLPDWYRNSKSVGQYLDLLVDKTAQERGLYQTDFISKMLKNYLNGDNTYAKSIVTLVNFEIWCRQFL